MVVVQLLWLSGRALAAQARCLGFDFRQLPALYFCLKASNFSLICSQAMIYCYHHTPCQGQIHFKLHLDAPIWDSFIAIYQKACYVNTPTGCSQQSVSDSVALPCHEAFTCRNVYNLLPYARNKDLYVRR